MYMRYVLALFGATALSVFAQGTATIFQTAPPEIDAALRERVNKFYQSHVDGKFRQAMEVVAEDSQDTFFAADKPKYKSFKIVNINYEDKTFTKARVLVEVPWELLTPLGVINSVPRPMASFWKQENGQWFWYVIPYDPCKGIDAGMFGKLHKQECVDGKPVNTSQGTAPNGGLPPMGTWPTIKGLQDTVRASNDRVMLSSHQPTSVAVRIDNKFEGAVTLSLEVPELPGLSAKLSRAELASGESTAVQIAYNPPAPQLNPEQVVRVRVQPIAKVIEIVVAFDKPPVDLSSGVKTAESANPKK